MSLEERMINAINRKYTHLLSNKPLKLITTGSANDVLLVDKDGRNPRVFRFPKEGHVDAKRHIRLEQKLMPLLRSWAPHIPHYDIIEESPYPYVSYPMIRGEPLLPPLDTKVPRDHLTEIAKQVAAVLYGLHAFPGLAYFPHELADPRYHQIIWSEHYKAVRHRAFPFLSERQKSWVVRLYEHFLQEEDHFKFQPCFINGDMKRDHILIDPITYQFQGIIDLGLTVGDPAIDFGYLRLGRSFLFQVLDHYQGTVDPTFVQRACFYHNSIPLSGLLIGIHAGDPTYIQISMRILTARMKEE